MPLSICGLADATFDTIDDTCPPSRSDIAGPTPLYGTCPTSMPVMDFRSSIERCRLLPTPADAKLILPGLALAAAMNSASVLNGCEGCTTSTFGSETSCVIGVRSRNTS